MRHARLSPHMLAGLLAVIFAVTSSFSKKHYQGAYYIQTGQPGCIPGILPAHCTTVTQATPQCTSDFGGAQRLWFKNNTCTVPAYELTGK